MWVLRAVLWAGRQSQEFMVESNSGEDTCAICSDYSANIEVATSAVPPVGRIADNPAIEEFATPTAKTIDDLVEQFGIPAERCAKSVVWMVDEEPWMILMRGNDEMNETKLQAIAGTGNVRPALNDELIDATGADHGSMGPVGLKKKIKVIADNLLKDANGMISGANRDGFHLKNIDLTRDCQIDEFHDLRTVQAGEPSITNGEPLRVVKAIELGHIFKLGTKYSDALGATFLDAEGKENPIIMGSYGIGVERVMACFMEQSYDEKGIIWKKPLAPFHVHLIGVNGHKMPEVAEMSDKLYAEMQKAGYEVLYDDREETAGIKFNDADLIGMPVQVICGSKNLKDGKLEIKYRASGEREIIEIAELEAKLKAYFA